MRIRTRAEQEGRNRRTSPFQKSFSDCVVRKLPPLDVVRAVACRRIRARHMFEESPNRGHWGGMEGRCQFDSDKPLQPKTLMNSRSYIPSRCNSGQLRKTPAAVIASSCRSSIVIAGRCDGSDCMVEGRNCSRHEAVGAALARHRGLGHREKQGERVRGSGPRRDPPLRASLEAQPRDGDRKDRVPPTVIIDAVERKRSLTS